jgi:PAS domain S-box-containing protein
MIHRWRWRDVPIRTKLTGGFAVLIGLVSAFIYLYFPARFEREARRNSIDEAMTVAHVTAYGVSGALYFNDAAAGRDVLLGAGLNRDVAYIVVSDTNGHIFASYNHPDSAVSAGDQQILDERAVYPVRVDVAFRGKVIGALDLGRSLRSLQNEIRTSRQAATLVSVLIFLCGMIAAVIFSRILTDPLRRITDVAVEIADGDVEKRAPVRSRDEVGILAESFNQMVDSLHEAQNQRDELNRSLEKRVAERTSELNAEVVERRAAEGELDKQRRFLRRIIDTDPNLIFSKDRDGRFTMVNAAVALVYGTSVEELVGKCDSDFNPNADEVRQFREADLAVLDAGQMELILEEPLTDAQGRRRWYQTIKLPLGVDIEGREQLLGVATDITARKEAEEALRRSEEQLRQAVKMEAVGRLAGGVAHDFNNLLAVILGQTELAQRRMDSDHPMTECMASIDDAAQRAADLTQQLLAFSRKQVLEPKVIDLNQIVSGTEKMLRRVIGENIALESTLAPELWTVLADPGQLQQVVMNLVINARDAMPNGGKLSILTSNFTLSQKKAARSGLIAPGPYVSLRIEDTGSGMDRDTLSRIFEPFFTTKGPGKGTGLGLATIFGIVEQSHGHIDVDSALGHGTTFQIYLPRSEAAVAHDAIQAPPSHADSPSKGSETILVVEDEPSVREMLSSMLDIAGYRVFLASDGQEALSVLATRVGAIDLLITDVIMPGMSGVELAANVTQISPGTRVLYMSGYTYDVIAQGGALEEGTLLLQKPFRMDTLERTVRSALAKPLPSSSSLACAPGEETLPQTGSAVRSPSVPPPIVAGTGST